jgi:alkylation response protein AidB-like acyl-CoA dehydrogenase
MEGITWSEPRRTTGLEAIPTSEVTLDGVSLQESRLVHGDGPMSKLMVWLDLLFGAVSLGSAMDFFEILSSWSEERSIKGQEKLKENPLCAALLAEVATEISVATLLLYDLAEMIAIDPHREQGAPSERLFTFAQLLGAKIQRGAFVAIDRGLELMGSAGYAKEWHAEKHWRDVKSIKALLCGPGGPVPGQLDVARYFYDCEKV